MGMNELDVFNPKAVATPDEMKAKVVALQEQLLKLPQADIVTLHSFRAGFYERTIVIPPWTVLTGAEHKTAYQVRIDKGTIAVNVEDGSVKIMSAPAVFGAEIGIQRALHSFEEEVIWTDIYANPDNCRDIEELERRLIYEPEVGLADNFAHRERVRMIEDYGTFLTQIGMSQPDMDKIVENKDDQIDMPEGCFVEVKPSKIHGNGLFATKDFKAGELICPGRINGKRTPAGRYMNHSTNANVAPEKVGDDLNAVATRDIYQGEELLVNYRESMRVNFGIIIEGEMPCHFM
jgi:hypothetical protein